MTQPAATATLAHWLAPFETLFTRPTWQNLLVPSRTLPGYLKSSGLLPWFDRDELRPGESWVARLQTDIAQVGSCAVIVGKSGIGPWQQQEVAGALKLFVRRQLPVVPVLLPGCGNAPELPLFLQTIGWVDFRRLDPDPVEQLVRAVAPVDEA